MKDRVISLRPAPKRSPVITHEDIERHLAAFGLENITKCRPAVNLPHKRARAHQS